MSRWPLTGIRAGTHLSRREQVSSCRFKTCRLFEKISTKKKKELTHRRVAEVWDGRPTFVVGFKPEHFPRKVLLKIAAGIRPLDLDPL
jgi:hypothetical protein